MLRLICRLTPQLIGLLTIIWKILMKNLRKTYRHTPHTLRSLSMKIKRVDSRAVLTDTLAFVKELLSLFAKKDVVSDWNTLRAVTLKILFSRHYRT